MEEPEPCPYTRTVLHHTRTVPYQDRTQTICGIPDNRRRGYTELVEKELRQDQVDGRLAHVRPDEDLLQLHQQYLQ